MELNINGKKIGYEPNTTFLYPDKHAETKEWSCIYALPLKMFPVMCEEDPEHAKEVIQTMIDNCNTYLTLDKEQRRAIPRKCISTIPPNFDPNTTTPYNLEIDVTAACVEQTRGLLEQMMEALT